MPNYRYFHPIEVRYGDLDPQGHVNNARYLTYFEQARIGYIRHLGLWKEGSFLELGIILASTSLSFLAPVKFGQMVEAGARVCRLGNKSMTMEYCLQDSQIGQALCTGTSVLVTYDYRSGESIPIPLDWRAAICAFEGLEPSECDP
jgi:acyl-CoA thioester hydrolase